ncbi:PstA family ABC transporter permease [Psychromicrobium sp. YIM B11713]|uniref:PstA family ABC transporter permease n=1 Tax=Psychromicrobium sp. YIM B11713 TaxID=3145233 RepID=UPI00374F7FD2
MTSTQVRSDSAAAKLVSTQLPRETMPAEAPPQQRVKVGLSRNDLLTSIGSLLAGVAIGLLLSAGLGLVPLGWAPIISYLWFLLIYTSLVFLTDRGPAVKNRFWAVILWSAAAIVVGSLALVIGFTATRGWDVFGNLNFFTQDMSVAGPLAGLDKGGILHALVATLEQISIALLISVPLSLTTAIFLNEVGGKFARLVRTIVEAMTALPSVVAGLFIYAAVVVGITKQFNGFAAALAITVLMLPIMIRSADVVLRLVPGNLREAGIALGAGQWRVVLHVVLPTVRSGLTTAIILGTAHGIGETAPVLLTSGVTNNLNFDPFNGPQTSLPLAALEFVKSPQPNMIARGFATAAFLLFVVLVMFIIARIIGGQEAGKLSNGQRRRRARKSRATLSRIEEAAALAWAEQSAQDAHSPSQQDPSAPHLSARQSQEPTS